MTSPVSPSETIAKAMEGVTPGPWLTHGAMLGHKGDVFAPTAKRVTDCHHIARCFAPKPEKQIICELQAIQTAREAASVSEANAAYIAACSPDRMREVLDELYALRETALQLEAMKREMAELREALKPFADYVANEWTDAHGDDTPVCDECVEFIAQLGAFRRARTLIQGEKK